VVYLRDIIFIVPIDEQSHFMSLLKCPLTHIVPKWEAFRERIKVFHSLFLHHFPLNSLIHLPDNGNLNEKGIKII